MILSELFGCLGRDQIFCRWQPKLKSLISKILISTTNFNIWDCRTMNSIGKNYVKKYFEDNIKVHLSFQFRKIWTRIGGVINV